MSDARVILEAVKILRERGWDAGVAWSKDGAELIARVSGRIVTFRSEDGREAKTAEALAEAADALLAASN